MNILLNKYITNGFPSVSDFYHGEADDLIADPEALLEHLDDLALALFLILDVHDGVVEVGVEFLAEALYLGDAELFHRGLELGHYHLDAAAVGLVRALQGQRTLKIVVHRKELREDVCLDVAVEADL